MGLIEEITSLMRKGPEALGKLDSLKINNKSIARGAKDATFQFPCLIVDSAPIDMASTIARTLDQVYASFTQTWLSMNSMFDITIDPTPLSYLKRIHQNMKYENGDDVLIDNEEDMGRYMEKVYDGSYRLFMDEEKNWGIMFNVADKGTRDMMESHKEFLKDYMSDFNLSPLEPYIEAPDDKITSHDLAVAMVDGQIQRNDDDRRDRRLQRSDRTNAPKLTDRDVKKANDLMPYGIEVKMIAVNDKKQFVQYMNFIVGVKTILHSVQSEDMIENIARALQNKSLMFKILKWTTGEISLIKDIILNLGDMKADAMNKRDGKSPFFGTLKRLKNKKLGVKNLTVPHALIPNATIVITSFEADYLKDNYAIDLRKASVGKKLISSLFLMAFVIMDEGTGTISVLYDGDDAFQTYALETLEKNNAMNSNKLGREIGRMISQ